MRIAYEGDLELAKTILSKSRDRPDYLNSFLENVDKMLNSNQAYFVGDFDMPKGLVQEPNDWFKGPFVDVRASKNKNSVAFIIPCRNLGEADRNPKTLEQIARVFAEFKEKPEFKEILTSSEHLLVAEIDRDKISFIPIEDYRHSSEIVISRNGETSFFAEPPKAEYHSNQYDKRIVDVRIDGGKKILDCIKSYRLAKKLGKELPEANIFWWGLGLFKTINIGYEWNSGNPIIFDPETREKIKKARGR